MKTTVIYHSADFDGIFCREIAKKFLGDSAEYIGWNFGDKPLMMVPGSDDFGKIIVMDLPVDRPFGFNFQDFERGQSIRSVLGEATELVWIDHHKSSIESHPKDIPGYRIDGVAACRLAWQWFKSVEVAKQKEGSGMGQQRLELTEKRNFVDRQVSEPLAVRLAGEYDIWDKRDSDVDRFQYGLRAEEPATLWATLLSEDTEYLLSILEQGTAAMRYAKNMDASICNSITWLMDWEGLKFLCVNHARFNSSLFAARDNPETGHDALLGFRFDGKSWLVSLYHAAHRKDLDLSQIAVKYGGGGHRGACGFTCQRLPFLT